jgi:hypothetical protein
MPVRPTNRLALATTEKRSRAWSGRSGPEGAPTSSDDAQLAPRQRSAPVELVGCFCCRPAYRASHLVPGGCIRGDQLSLNRAAARFGMLESTLDRGSISSLGGLVAARASHRGRVRIANRPKAAAAALAGARMARDNLDMTTPPAAAPPAAPRYRAELLRASAKFDCLGFAAMARCC